MKTAFPRLMLPALLLLSSGCVATQRDMLQMQGQMDDLNGNLTSMQRNQADLAVKMEELSASLNANADSMKEISYKMEELTKRLDEVDSGMDRRVNAIGQTLKQQQEEMKKQQQEVEASLLPAKLYNDAYLAWQSGSYDAAIAGFREYLGRYPDGQMAEGARFFSAEANYAKGNWKEAAIAYAAVLAGFPKSPRTASARLKYAFSLLKLPEDKKDEAVSYLESVTYDFPSTAEARAAEEKLKELNPPAPPKKAQPKASKTAKSKK